MSENIEQPTISGSNGSKNEIKITAEGVARLTFNYLDEMLGDSSLEPGEVKSPQISHSPATISEIAGLELGEIISPTRHDKRLKETSIDNDKIKSDSDAIILEQSTASPVTPAASGSKHKKSASQLEAEACEEKVRAILELDAVKRREEAEKRKEEKIKTSVATELSNAETEEKCKEKEERKRIKRLKRKKEQQAARLLLLSDEEVQKCLTDEKFAESKLSQTTEDNESEGLYSSPSSTPEPSDDSPAVASAVVASPSPRYGPLTPNHIPSYPTDTFITYRTMNPFMRGMRGDFNQSRGFVPRIRGGLRSNMRFPGYRPPFFVSGLPRHHPGSMKRTKTPTSSRRHSPIRAPNSNVMWTKTKPAITYAFNNRYNTCPRGDHKTETDTTNSVVTKTSKTKSKSKTSDSADVKNKKTKKVNKQERVKKQRNTTHKTKNTSKQNIELIRKSFEKPASKLSTQDSKKHTSNTESEQVRKKQNSSKESTPTPVNVVSDAKDQNDLESSDNSEVQEQIKENEVADEPFDMFADSPPKNQNQFEKEIDDLLHSARLATKRIDATNKEVKRKNLDLHVAANEKKSTQGKTSLEKALETQKRIDKLLQEDDIQLEALQATKEKLMKETKRHNQATVKSPKRVLTPENLKHKNPFKRSLSSDRFFGSIDTKRFSRSRDRKPKRNRNDGNDLTRDRDRCRDRDRKKSKPRSWSRGRSSKSAQRTQKDNTMKQRANPALNNSRSKSRDGNKNKRSTTPPTPVTPPLVYKRSGVTKTKKEKGQGSDKKAHVVQRKQPVSFSASEFLFPEECEESIDNDDQLENDSRNAAIESENTLSSSDLTDEKIPITSFTVESPNDISPDTNDYIDNWEHEDPDEDTNIVCTPQGTSLSRLDDKFEARFVNPSPPMELVRDQTLEESSRTSGTTPTTSPPKIEPKIFEHAETINKNEIVSGVNEFDELPFVTTKVKHQLFGMQEIYEQFMKSVVESDLQAKATIENATTSDDPDLKEPENILTTEPEQKEEPQPSTYSTTSTTTATTTITNTTVTATTVLKSIGSPPKESNLSTDNSIESFDNIHEQSNPIANVNEFDLAPITHTENDHNKAITNEDLTLISIESLTDIPDDGDASEKPRFTPPSSPTPSTGTSDSPVLNAEKAIVSRDFKKLRNLNANLKRIRKMRLTLDSSDDIEEELVKMEKLFMQEKNAILQKYTKNTAATTATTAAEQFTATTIVATDTAAAGEITYFAYSQTGTQGSFIPAMQQPTEPEPNKIFDTNREAIKLTISPMKLPKTSAIFKEESVGEHEDKSTTESEDKDFTEWLAKPGKEVAIVKPMMESKESRDTSSSQHRYQRQRTNSRSPYRSRNSGNHRDKERYRRSVSRSRTNSRHRSRGATLSVSPPRRGRHAVSPTYRNRLSTSRSIARRSRSRSRSDSRPTSSKRIRELSPPMYRKRRQLPLTHGSHFRRKRTLSRSRTRSPKPRSPLSPRSRKRYSRSPLPFKPPSPPMRRSLSPSSSVRDKSSRRSTSSPRSPRSPQSPRSPRSPLSSPTAHLRCSTAQDNPYYGKNTGLAASTYYYNDPASRISLDTRINIVLNSPQDSASANIVSYGGYTNYGHYSNTSATFMSMATQPPSVDNNKYYRNEFLAPIGPATGTPTPPPQHQHQHAHPHSHSHGHSHGHQQMYSNIPTISSADTSHFYYNEFGGHNSHQNQRRHQSASLLKELPKAPATAVQKGNVLEIVPSAESDAPTMSPTKTASKSEQNPTDSTKELVVAAVKQSGVKTKKGIIKKSRSRKLVKRVKFEDGVIPNYDSGDEDGADIETKILRRLHRLLKRRSLEGKNNPPPQPLHLPTTNLPQPIYRRPPSPPIVYFFHWDGAVNSMYISQTETPIPPRLFNPKLAPLGNSTTSSSVQSPLYSQTPYATMRRDAKTIVANRSIRVKRIAPRAMTPPPYLGHSHRNSPSPSVYHTAEQRTSKASTSVGTGSFANMRPNNFPSMRPPQAPFARSGYNTQRTNPVTVNQTHMPATAAAAAAIRFHTSRLGLPLTHSTAVNEFLGKMHSPYIFPPPTSPQINAVAGSATTTTTVTMTPPTAIIQMPQQHQTHHNFTYFQRPATPQMYTCGTGSGGLAIGVSGGGGGIGVGGKGSGNANVSAVVGVSNLSSHSHLLSPNALASPVAGIAKQSSRFTAIASPPSSLGTVRFTFDNQHYAVLGQNNGSSLNTDKRTNVSDIEITSNQQSMFSPFQM